jgi:hypothetical protein
MNLKDAVAVAKKRLEEVFAAEVPQNLRLEQFLWDDHLGVWSLTIGFARRDRPDTRSYKLVRVLEADKSVLSINDP